MRDAVAILRVLVVANRDRASSTSDVRMQARRQRVRGETRVHAICIHDVGTRDYVSLSHGRVPGMAVSVAVL